MVRDIGIASFKCGNCGHISTPPEAINSIPHQMEKYAVVDVKDLPDSAAEVAKLAALKKKHANNDFTITREPDLNGKIKPVVRVKRCYSKVLSQSNSILEESDEIVLGCPQCNTELYRVRWK